MNSLGNKGKDDDTVLNEIKTQIAFMKRVKAIVLFKMGNKGEAIDT